MSLIKAKDGKRTNDIVSLKNRGKYNKEKEEIYDQLVNECQRLSDQKVWKTCRDTNITINQDSYNLLIKISDIPIQWRVLLLLLKTSKVYHGIQMTHFTYKWLENYFQVSNGVLRNAISKLKNDGYIATAKNYNTPFDYFVVFNKKSMKLSSK